MSLPVHLHDRRQRKDRRRAEPHPISAELLEALENGHLELIFQPQFCGTAQRVYGAEALVRWHHPEYGMLSGDTLVAIAHSGGNSRHLARHVARGALAEAARWPDHLRLSLNVTAMDLFDRSFGEELLAMLGETGFPPQRLTLEITEQALVADLDRSAKRLRVLAEHGITIALDDFGAGFCNFRYLKVLPLDVLKLDRSMIEGIVADERDLAVLRGIVAMADALKIAVVAEGIETAEQRDVATREGCAVWQGFLGGRPVEASEFAKSFAS